jgi:signal transduction histidine kinase
MNPFRSLWVKLVVAFVLVAVVAVGVVAWAANRATTREFELYVSQGKLIRAERLAPEFAAYYARTSSWTGVEEWMASLAEAQATGRGQGQRRGRGRSGGYPADRLLLVEADGQVLADSEGELVGQRLSITELGLGTPITVAGQVVGILILPVGAGTHESLEAEFLRQVNNSLLWAGLIAGAVALILGLLLARQLTAPLRTLTYAARRLAGGQADAVAGEAPLEVPVRSRDEIGELGQAFNQMSMSLARQETLRRNLMADIAHELRTPLSVMRSDLEALLDGVYEPTQETLGSLHEETLLLSRLVDDLRDLALAEAGKLRLERQPTDLGKLLRGVISSFEPYASAQSQNLSLDLPPGLPLVDVDPQRVRQVVANLVSNALQHSYNSQEAADAGDQVIVSAIQQFDAVEVSVDDNGPGITPADLPHVFDRFWQGDRARAGSSGLGLAISQELVRAHGGRIWVESTPGQGATFRFTLPLHRGQ